MLLVRDPADHAYGSVVAACDFSPASDAALRMGQRLAPQAKFHPVHAVHVPSVPGGYHGPELTDSFMAEARAQAADWQETLQDSAPDASQDIEELAIIEGAAHPVIWQACEAHSADLLTVGAHGRMGASPALMGSMAHDLMRNAACDLLIARRRHG